MPVSITGNIAQVGNDGLVITDATANASDIMSGKVAYNNNGRVVGSHVDKTYGDFVYNASAGADDIMYGKTAFVDSGKITGRHVDKVYSDFVNGTTATAGDIARGKVAFINSGRVVGTNAGSSYSDFVNDATAVSSDLASGKVAYNNSGRFVGTHRDKVYGDFVYDATAYASDVAYGKVFYNNSGRQVGTKQATSSSVNVKSKMFTFTRGGGSTLAFGLDMGSVELFFGALNLEVNSNEEEYLNNVIILGGKVNGSNVISTPGAVQNTNNSSNHDLPIAYTDSGDNGFVVNYSSDYNVSIQGVLTSMGSIQVEIFYMEA